VAKPDGPVRTEFGKNPPTFSRSLAGMLMKSLNLHSESVGTFFQSEHEPRVGHQVSPPIFIFRGPMLCPGTGAGIGKAKLMVGTNDSGQFCLFSLEKFNNNKI
jgi:hypothetical protein